MDFERGAQTSDAQGRIVIRRRGWSPYTRTAAHYAANVSHFVNAPRA